MSGRITVLYQSVQTDNPESTARNQQTGGGGPLPAPPVTPAAGTPVTPAAGKPGRTRHTPGTPAKQTTTYSNNRRAPFEGQTSTKGQSTTLLSVRAAVTARRCPV
jgi:hypothetical protein